MADPGFFVAEASGLTPEALYAARQRCAFADD
jgi:hypothetical protein